MMAIYRSNLVSYLIVIFLVGYAPVEASWFVSSFASLHQESRGVRLGRGNYLFTNSRCKSQLFQQSPSQDRPKYSRDVLLREEAESPFRKIRFALYFTLGAGAMISLVISLSQTAAGLNGVNEDLLPTSIQNLAVDVIGLAALTYFYQQDMKAQESRLKRATRGAELARLLVRGPINLFSDPEVVEDDETNASVESGPTSSIPMITTTLASLRRGRGMEKRVVIAAAGIEKIGQVVQEATRLEASLVENDLLVVPVVIPSCTAPPIQLEGRGFPGSLAIPMGTANWKLVLADETQEAQTQGVDVNQEGFCVILKKNGKVGQRTRGIFLDRMVGDVTQRQEMGMDVTNI